MNSYNIYNAQEPSTILFHAIARDEAQVIDLANEQGVDLSELTVEIERTNVKDQLGRPLQATINDAIVH